MKQFELNQLKEPNDGRVRTLVVANNSRGFYSEALEPLRRRTYAEIKVGEKLQQVYKIEKNIFCVCVTVTWTTLIQKKLVCVCVNGTGNLKGFYETISSCHSVQNCKINFEMTSVASLSLPPPSLHHRGKHSSTNIQRSVAPHFIDRRRRCFYVEVYVFEAASEGPWPENTTCDSTSALCGRSKIPLGVNK